MIGNNNEQAETDKKYPFKYLLANSNRLGRKNTGAHWPFKWSGTSGHTHYGCYRDQASRVAAAEVRACRRAVTIWLNVILNFNPKDTVWLK